MIWLFIGGAYAVIFGLLGYALAKAASHEMPEHPGSRTPVRGPGLDPGGGDDGTVPRREPAAGPLDGFADDVRATLGHPPAVTSSAESASRTNATYSTGGQPNPYDYYTDRHPKRPVADPDPRAVRQRDPNLRDGPARR